MKKLIVLLLIVCMVIGGLPMYAGVNPDISTDGAAASFKWFQMFENLLGANKEQNANDFYDVLNSLKTMSEADFQVELNKDRADDDLLQEYGLTASTIRGIVMYYLDTYPTSAAEVIAGVLSPGNNIYADIYADLYAEEDVDYSDFMVRFYDYLRDQYFNLPTEMKAPIPDWDADNQGEIHVFQNIMNSVIRDYIFHLRINSITNEIDTKEMYLGDNVEGIIRNELRDISGLVDSPEIAEYARMYYELGNVILRTAETNLKNSGNIDKAIRLGDLVTDGGTTLVRRQTFTPDNDDDDDDDTVTFFNFTIPSIAITPEFATIVVNPAPGTDEGQLQYLVAVANSTSPVVWSVEENPVVSIDQNGLATVNEGYVQDENSPDTVTVRATLENNATIFDEVTLIIDYNPPLAGVGFFGPYIKGYEDGSFKTKKNVSRAEAAAMFTRILSLDAKTETIDGEEVLVYSADKIETPSFKDIGKDHWAFLNIEIAKAEGLISGYGDGTFKPNEAMTRAEVAVLISNAWDALGMDKDISAKHEIIDVMPDHWAYREINSVFNALVVDGFEDNSFRPEEYISREQVVTMINNIINRPEYLLPGDKFSDVTFGYWAYGNIISATMFQVQRADGTFELRETNEVVEQ